MQTKHKSKACTDALHTGSGGSQAQTQAPVREKSPAGKKTTKDAKSRTCVKSARKQTGETCAMPHAAKGSGTEASEAQSVREGTNPAPLAMKSDTLSDTFIRENARNMLDKRIYELSRSAVRAALAEIGEAALVAFAGQIYRIEERLRVMASVSGTATDALTQSLRWGRYALSIAGAVDEAEALSTITFTTKDNPEEGIALALAKDAEWMWLAYQDKAKRLCLENEFNVSLREWLALVARDVTGEIAMLFHFMSYSCPQIRLVISAEDMARALEIGDVLIEHAQEAWSKLKKAQSDAPGKVLALVLRKGWPVFSARDCYQSLRRQLPFYSMKPMNKALASLVEQGCILPISMKGKNGRAMVRYELNPVPQQGREIKCPFVLGIPQTFSLTLTLGNS
ncbi:hypothetical protein B5F76_12755 [Desulfovibrio sp. An276]|uniref:DUF3987 domain-containing protein n=1 Tax=Desulfovibrio sp. An276 TaxID=1965618 RepID=UPI000B397398|nr:DUF3987 domain-containing protein [Desulfovibrio sp. An276]OUO49979.1 hypothetical protein B5F76_12755 [Desulfovibrio sp. An276]